MLDNFLGRIEHWWNQVRADLAKLWWWSLVGIPLAFLYRLTEERILAATNKFIDEHVSLSSLKPTIIAFWSSPFLHPIAIAAEWLFAGIFIILAHAYWTTRSIKTKPPDIPPSQSLLERTRRIIRELGQFVDANEGNATAIHFGYDAKFRSRIDGIFSELAAEDIFDILEGDWTINPKTQTVRNIRTNIIARLSSLADRLAARESAPRLKLIGELESAKVVMTGDHWERGGEREYHAEVVVNMRVTTDADLSVTIKRASLELTFDGKTYRGHNQALWLRDERDGPDLLKKITSDTPIKQGAATVGAIEFHVEGFRGNHAITADATVVLVDEFNRRHQLRNSHLRIAA
jgi:hypothetical protein